MSMAENADILRPLIRALLIEREGLRAVLKANLGSWRLMHLTDPMQAELKHRMVGMTDEILSVKSAADVLAEHAAKAVAEPEPKKKPLSPRNQKRQLNQALRKLRRLKDKLDREAPGAEPAEDAAEAEVGRIYTFPGGSED
jgi:hypothetical protein